VPLLSVVRRVIVKSHNRSGFTVVELLVVLIVIGVILGITLPAVQRARSAAARMRCGDHHRQLALAAHQFHDVHGRLPTNQLIVGDNASEVRWGTHLLDFIEQSELRRRYRDEAGPSAPVNRQVVVQPLALFRCPAQTIEHPEGYGRADLAINAALIEGRGLSLSDVRDGTSTTILFGEIVNENDYVTGWALGGVIDVVPLPNPNHSGGAWTVACDGSVHFLHSMTSTRIVEALMTPSNGEVVASFHD
jgi:prepilin-type N-terminal cleavage/methylation domain-containing protein